MVLERTKALVGYLFDVDNKIFLTLKDAASICINKKLFKLEETWTF